MPHRQQLTLVIDQLVIDQIISDEEGIKKVESAIINDYQKLSEKCDVVISKIKKRKSKKQGKN
ncbi:MAG TPA: hypothetical protein VEP90_30680 [Methylomirabilota bacterium]|nr:hypothetical protein [Methylomirabilota bacterium]